MTFHDTSKNTGAQPTPNFTPKRHVFESNHLTPDDYFRELERWQKERRNARRTGELSGNVIDLGEARRLRKG
jgi:hypothetical protein